MNKKTTISINGRTLTTCQTMTMLVAFDIFASAVESGELGEDETGKLATELHTTYINEIREAIAKPAEHPVVLFDLHGPHGVWNPWSET